MGRQVTVRPGAPRGRARGENRARMERLERGLGRRGGPRPRSWSVAPGCLGRETGKRRARPREREREKGAVFAGAGAQQSAGSAGPRSGDSGAGRDSVSATLDAFVRFTRPHTVLGTAISVTSVSLLAARSTAEFNLSLLSALATALCAALSANVSIVGLNQLYDVEIDRVNKPYLPLASGEFSAGQGAWIVGASGALGLGIALASGSKPLALTVAASLLLGVFYSADLPLLRWKRYPVLAATCILSVRAVIVQLGFFAHARRALALASGDQVAPLARDLGGSLGLVFGTGFMVLFSVSPKTPFIATLLSASLTLSCLVHVTPRSQFRRTK